jgi:hypothetical protein
MIVASDRGAILHFARRYDDAIRSSKVLTVEPDEPRAPDRRLLAESGRYTEAHVDVAQIGRGPWPWA